MTAPYLPVKVVDDPVGPNQISKASLRAIRKVSLGEAEADEQKVAFAAILRICGVDDLEWRPTERESSFAGGKRHVGLQLRKLTELDLNLLTGET